MVDTLLIPAWPKLKETLNGLGNVADALPQQTFSTSHKLQASGETVMLQYFQPAHTDTAQYSVAQRHRRSAVRRLSPIQVRLL